MSHGDCDYCDRGKGEAIPLALSDDLAALLAKYPDVDVQSQACARCRHQFLLGLKQPKRK